MECRGETGKYFFMIYIQKYKFLIILKDVTFGLGNTSKLGYDIISYGYASNANGLTPQRLFVFYRKPSEKSDFGGLHAFLV